MKDLLPKISGEKNGLSWWTGEFIKLNLMCSEAETLLA